MDGLVDPYRPGEPPQYLAGRDQELESIRYALARVIAYGEMAGPQLILHGPRGVGKTSLLRAAQDSAQRSGLLYARTSCSDQQPFLADVRDVLDRTLARADLTRDADRWTAAAAKVGVQLAVPAFARFSAEVSAGRKPKPPPGAITAIEDMLAEASAAAARKGGGRGVGLVLAIDELHAANLGELSVFLNALQNLSQERESHPLAVLGAGLPSVRGVVTRAATFGERSKWIRVDSLTEDATREALVRPAEEMGVAWDPGALSSVVHLSRGYPEFVQKLGSSTWRAARPQSGATLTVADVERGLPASQAEIFDMYVARWEAATDAERQLIRTMARIGGDGEVARADLQQSLGQDISPIRAQLINKAVISDVRRGRLKFTLPGFAEFVQKYADGGASDAGPNPWPLA